MMVGEFLFAMIKDDISCGFVVYLTSLDSGVLSSSFLEHIDIVL